MFKGSMRPENEGVQSRRFGTFYARCAVGTLEGGELEGRGCVPWSGRKMD